MKGFFRRLPALLLCALLCLSMVNIAGAEQTGTLTVSYPIDGTVYHLYSVGTLENGQIVLDRAFRRVDTSDYAKAASVMADMVKLTGAGKELASAKVSGGKAVFTDLPMAVYLVLFLFISVVCFAAVIVIAFTRCMTIALNNRQVYDDLGKLGASRSYLYASVKGQVSRVFTVPAITGTGAIYAFYAMIMYANDGRLTLNELAGMGPACC